MLYRGLLTSLISISSTSCITYCVLKYLRAQNISPVPLSYFVCVTLPTPADWRKIHRALWDYSWLQPHSCGETIRKVIMGSFQTPHFSVCGC